MEVCSFNSKLAKKFGINEATFIQLLYCLIQDNKSMCIIEDEISWFPCSIKEWENYIDLWTYRQTDRIVKNCLSQGILYLRHYDDDERRRRGWYGINRDIVPLLEKVNQTLASGQ